MSWEDSRALTPLKRDILHAFFALETRFFLTGGSALGIFYLEHRMSFDLDLFSASAFDWLEIDGALRSACLEIGASLSPLRTFPTFRRYQALRGQESEVVDIVKELCPQVDTVKNRFGDIVVDTEREIALNKICTLLSRAETKDIVDLYFLEQRGILVEDNLEAAKMKDAGLDPAVLSMLLSQVRIKEPPPYLLKPLPLGELIRFVENLRLRMADLAFPD